MNERKIKKKWKLNEKTKLRGKKERNEESKEGKVKELQREITTFIIINKRDCFKLHLASLQGKKVKKKDV